MAEGWHEMLQLERTAQQELVLLGLLAIAGCLRLECPKFRSELGIGFNYRLEGLAKVGAAVRKCIYIRI